MTASAVLLQVLVMDHHHAAPVMELRLAEQDLAAVEVLP
jgi:hypothetical protein